MATAPLPAARPRWAPPDRGFDYPIRSLGERERHGNADREQRRPVEPRPFRIERDEDGPVPEVEPVRTCADVPEHLAGEQPGREQPLVGGAADDQRRRRARRGRPDRPRTARRTTRRRPTTRRSLRRRRRQQADLGHRTVAPQDSVLPLLAPARLRPPRRRGSRRHGCQCPCTPSSDRRRCGAGHEHGGTERAEAGHDRDRPFGAPGELPQTQEHERPHDVELLLDGEAPQCGERRRLCERRPVPAVLPRSGASWRRNRAPAARRGGHHRAAPAYRSAMSRRRRPPAAPGSPAGAAGTAGPRTRSGRPDRIGGPR